MHGEHGEDPTDPRVAGRTPGRPVSHEPRIQQALRRRWPRLATIRSTPRRDPAERGGPALEPVHPVRGRATAIPCLVHAKSDAEVIAVRPLHRPAQRDAAGATRRSERLETDPSGTDSHVRGGRAVDGSERDLPATSSSSRPGRRNAAILLRSAIDRHPDGLANGSDQVGRNYMFHNSQAVLALVTETNETLFQKTLGLNDFYLARRRPRVPHGQHPDVGQVLTPGDVWARSRKLTKLAPDWTPQGDRPPRGRLLAHDRGPPRA